MAMQRTIHKFTVEVNDELTKVHLPRNAKIVHVGIQKRYTVSAWYERSFEEAFATPYEEHVFQVYGTGHPIPLDAEYVGTVIDGILVWHLYERHLLTGSD